MSTIQRYCAAGAVFRGCHLRKSHTRAQLPKLWVSCRRRRVEGGEAAIGASHPLFCLQRYPWEGGFQPSLERRSWSAAVFRPAGLPMAGLKTNLPYQNCARIIRQSQSSQPELVEGSLLDWWYRSRVAHHSDGGISQCRVSRSRFAPPLGTPTYKNWHLQTGGALVVCACSAIPRSDRPGVRVRMAQACAFLAGVLWEDAPQSGCLCGVPNPIRSSRHVRWQSCWR